MTPDPISRHAVLISYALLGMLVAALIWFPPENSGDVAAWVQGVGTIAAVLVAFWAANSPARAAALQNARTLKTLAQLLRQTLNMLKPMIRDLERDARAGDFKEAVRSAFVIDRGGALDEVSGLIVDGAGVYPTDLTTMLRSLRRDIAIFGFENLKVINTLPAAEQGPFLAQLLVQCWTILIKISHIEAKLDREA